MGKSKLRVLMYHKVDEHYQDFLTLTSNQLDKQLSYIGKHFNCIRLSDLLKHLEDGSPLPKNPLLITFDDGYLNNYTLAYPLFKKHKLPFSIFLVADFLERTLIYDNKEQAFLGEKHCLEMSDWAEFGCHAFSHINLNDLPSESIEDEIQTTYSSLKAFNFKILPAWAYTYGAYPKKDRKAFEQLKQTFKKTGIQAAFRIGNRLNTFPLKDKYCIQRLDMRGTDSNLKFHLKLTFGKLF